MISYKYLDGTFIFETPGCEINDWANLSNTGLNHLIGLLSEGTAESIGPNSISIKEVYVANFSPKVLSALSLPELSPFSLKIQTSGTILRNNFEIHFQFMGEIGPVIGAEVEGCFIRKGSKTYLLGEPYYSSVNLIRKFHAVTELNAKLSCLKDLKGILPAEVFSGDERLKSFNLIRATKLSLDVKDETDFNLVPEFVLPNDPDTTLLAPAANESLKNQFHKRSVCSNIYQVSRNTFLILDPVVYAICKEIKSTNNKSKAERASFYYNPQKYITENLAHLVPSEILDDVFVESQLFISKRISHIGIWEPKIHAFVPKSGNNWIPKDLITIQAGDVLVSVDPDKIEDAISKINNAKAEGKETVTINGTTIKITDDLIESFIKTQNGIKNLSPGKQDGSSPFSTPKTVKEIIRLAAIVKDNIGDDYYQEIDSTVRSFTKFLPTSLKTTNLFDYQQIGIAWLQESFNQGKRGVILADDMGLGKSLQCLAFLAWIRERISSGDLAKKPILVVGPTGLLQNWKDEHSKHLHYPGLGDVIDAFGDSFKALRKLAFKEGLRKLSAADWVLTTYDTLRDQERYFRAVDWLVIVFDESQAIKNPSSLKTDMAKAMAADFSIAMTGTPVENTLCDLWCISDTVFPGKLGLYKNFKERYERTSDNLKELKRIVVDDLPSFMLRRLKIDNLKGLPNRQVEVRNIKMSNDQARDYQKVIDNFKTGNYGSSKFQVIHDLKRTSLYDYKNPDAEFEHHLNYSGRLQLLISVIEEVKSRDEKCLVFIESREIQALLIPYLQKRFKLKSLPLLINGTISGKLRKLRVDDFQNRPPGFDVMLISPKAGGTGLTITAANNVIHLDRWWNPAVEDQCNDRCYRIGQTKDVKVYYLLNLHPTLNMESFDGVLHQVLDNKRLLCRDVIVPPELSKEELQQFYFKVTGDSIDFEDGPDNFYISEEWKILKERVFATYERRCMKCSCINIEMHVDHIKPRSKYPELELVFDNLQVLCGPCNISKSNREIVDYRVKVILD